VEDWFGQSVERDAELADELTEKEGLDEDEAERRGSTSRPPAHPSRPPATVTGSTRTRAVSAYTDDDRTGPRPSGRSSRIHRSRQPRRDDRRPPEPAEPNEPG
jgi:hypothetical protein